MNATEPKPQSTIASGAISYANRTAEPLTARRYKQLF